MSLASIWGVYVPSLYDVYYEEDGTFSQIEKRFPEAPLPIVKRIAPSCPPR